MYAHHILRGRFELGEPALENDILYKYRYQRDIIGFGGK